MSEGWDKGEDKENGMRTYPGDGLDEAGLVRALIADDDDAGELDVDVRAVVRGK